MRFKKEVAAGGSLEIENIDFVDNGDKQFKKHGPLLPHSLRCIICGPSNCGKTNVMIGLLTHPNGLYFKNVYVYSKSLYQPKYKYLEKVLDSLVEYNQFKDSDDILPPAQAKFDSVFIFDDVACDNQSPIRDYFSMGRHKRVDCFYLCQTYTRIPKHLVRDNANFMVLFKQDDLNLRMFITIM
jgi:Poxvirus A32 protein.